MREKYFSGWKFTIVYNKHQPNEQAVSESIPPQKKENTPRRKKIDPSSLISPSLPKLQKKRG